MEKLTRTWQLLTVVLVALSLGLAFAHVLERPAKMQYPADLYVTLQRSLYVHWGPPSVGGILEPARASRRRFSRSWCGGSAERSA